MINYIFLFVVVAGCSLMSGGQLDKKVQSEELAFEIDTVVTGFNIPWGMVFLPDGSMLVAEKSGEIFPVKDGKKGTAIENVPQVYNRGQGGLMDLELHPNYAENGWLYITFSSEEGEDNGGNTKLIRCKLQEGALVEIEDLYKGAQNSTKGQHFGSRIEFDNQGFLYFTIGDRGNRDENPQDITRDNGKVYRLNDDGSIPKSNPFVDQENAKKAIFSFGHRNPQGLALHPQTGELWEHEHGPRGGDEINIIEKGNNYGWPEITYGINYSGTVITEDTAKEGMEQPILYWDPSIAPCGMDFITGDNYPAWEGDLLVGSLKFRYLLRCELDGRSVIQQEKLLEGIGRVRNVRMGPDNLIYVAVEQLGIIRLIPVK